MGFQDGDFYEVKYQKKPDMSIQRTNSVSNNDWSVNSIINLIMIDRQNNVLIIACDVIQIVDAEIYHIHLLNNNQLSGKVIGMELDIKNGLLIAFSDSIN